MTRCPSKFFVLPACFLILVACNTLHQTKKNHPSAPASASLKGFQNANPSQSGNINPGPTSAAGENEPASEPQAGSEPFGSEVSPALPEETPDASVDSAAMDSEPALDSGSADETDPDQQEEGDEDPGYDVPIVINESVEDYIEYFNTTIRDRFKLWLERSGRYIPVMREIFKEYGLPEDLVFVALIESGFNPYAYSRARAVGPWQFIRGTGKLYGLKIDNWVDERRDPIKSTHAAAKYLRDLYQQFGSWPLAMAAYNAGEGKIERALAKAKTADYWDLRPTRYIRRETKGYVPKFMAATIIAKNPERYGFTLDYHDPLQFDMVTVPGSADLRVMAQAAAISYEDLKALNPELRTELTPPYVEHYSLRLPNGAQESFLEAYAQIPEERKVIGTRHTIRRGDTLSTIARRFGTTVPLLREINHLAKNQQLRVGETLFIPKLKNQAAEPKRQVVSATPRPSVKSAAPSSKTPIQMTSLERQGQQGDKILYQVKEGDTLWDISQSFNVSIQDLRRYNGLKKRSIIRPGDQLILGFESKDS